MYSKAEGYCARLALILYLARVRSNEYCSPEVDEASIDGAIKFVEYFKAHAVRVYGHASVTNDKGKIANALRSGAKHANPHVTARIAKANGLVSTTLEAIELFQCLEELGHGTYSPGSKEATHLHLSAKRTVMVEECTGLRTFCLCDVPDSPTSRKAMDLPTPTEKLTFARLAKLEPQLNQLAELCVSASPERQKQLLCE